MVVVVNVMIVAAIGAAGGLGVLVVVAGVRGVSLRPSSAGGTRRSVDRLLLRCALAVGCGLLVALATRWPVAVVIAGIGGFTLPTAIAASGRHRRELARIEAIAGWVEQLRDTLSAANGLEHALVSSARVAPAAIAPEVGRLAARSGYEPLPVSLRRFAGELDHPLGDFVVAALIVASEHQARDLAALLGQLAEAARDEARLRQRVWVGRARTRTAVRVIGGVLTAVIAGLLVLDRDYLSPYDSATGQLVLMVIAAMFAGALVAMERLGRIELPERFIAAGGGEVTR